MLFWTCAHRKEEVWWRTMKARRRKISLQSHISGLSSSLHPWFINWIILCFCYCDAPKQTNPSLKILHLFIEFELGGKTAHTVQYDHKHLDFEYFSTPVPHDSLTGLLYVFYMWQQRPNIEFRTGRVLNTSRGRTVIEECLNCFWTVLYYFYGFQNPLQNEKNQIVHKKNYVFFFKFSCLIM